MGTFIKTLKFNFCMKNQFKKYVLKIAISLILVQLIVGCVQSGVGNPNDKVGITITSPTTGDSVQIGENTILYKISNPAAIALDHFEIILNNGDSVRIVKAKDNLNGTQLLLGIDSSLISTTVSYYVNVATKNNVFTTSEVQSNLFVTENRNPPAAPTNLTLTKLGGTTTTFSTNLEWVDNADNETTYELWRKEGSSANYSTTPYKIFSANTQRINDDGLSRFVVYSYKVSAKNKYGRSKFSNEVSTADQPDEAPTNLTATVLGASKVKLTWDDNAIAKLGYRIQRSDLTSTQYVQVALVTTKEYLDKNLSPRTTYSYRVQSFTSTSESKWTNPVNATTLASDVPPPANLTAVFDSTTKFVTVSWIDNTFLETGTSIERKKGLNGSYSEIGTTNTDVNVFVDQSAAPGFIYVYRAKYSTSLGFDTDYSNEAQVFVPELPPLAPSDLLISTLSPNVYLLNWKLNSNDEDRVEIWRKDGSSGQYQLVKTLPAKTIADVVSIPNSNLIYYFKIRAARNTLVSDFSNEVGTDGSSGANDITLSGGATGSSTIQITWTNISSPKLGFSIERKIVWEQDSAFKVIMNVGAALLAYGDSGLQSSTTYSYRVRAIFSQGYSNYSNVVNITTNP